MTERGREAYWREQLAAWQASDLSGQAFCREHDLVYHQFGYWRRKLADQPQAEASNGAGFARVIPAGASARSAGLTVSLPSGLSISGIDAGNIALVGSIVRQL